MNSRFEVVKLMEGEAVKVIGNREGAVCIFTAPASGDYCFGASRVERLAGALNQEDKQKWE